MRIFVPNFLVYMMYMSLSRSLSVTLPKTQDADGGSKLLEKLKELHLGRGVSELSLMIWRAPMVFLEFIL